MKNKEPHEYRLIFLAHPVRGSIKENLESAERWFELLERSFDDVAVQAPWITGCRRFNDANEDERCAGIAKNKACIRRCDEVWLCGEIVSSGMEEEARFAATENKKVFRVTLDDAGSIRLTRYAMGLRV